MTGTTRFIYIFRLSRRRDGGLFGDKTQQLIPNTPAKAKSGADIQKQGSKERDGNEEKAYTTNMHMITWVEKTRGKTRFEEPVEKIDGCEKRLMDD